MLDTKGSEKLLSDFVSFLQLLPGLFFFPLFTVLASTFLLLGVVFNVLAFVASSASAILTL